jgi:glycosyltransferase involved in cell wall biosynthesis
MTGRALPHVFICVPTFRRPEGLRKLLTHLEQSTYGGMIEVVVVDNDAVTRSGEVVVDQMASAYRFPLRCLIEPRRGQTYAYNRAFVTACCAMPAPDYVAVLDDDEYPHPDWLSEIIGVARSTEADILGGPVFPVFDAPEHWLARSGLLAPTRYKTGPVQMIYGAGNMLIRCGMLEHYLDEPFDHAFAFTGGSDYDFFWRCRKDGRSFAWADDAHVFETTPRSRTTVGYLLRRRFRTGTEATRIDRKLAGTVDGPLRRWCKALGLIGTGTLSLPFAVLAGRTGMMRSLMWTARGAGRIAAEFGISYEEYR